VPHIIVEHSKGIAAQIDIGKLLDALHLASLGLSALPVGGLRIRAYEASHARVGDGKPGREFVYITVRLGQGRSDAVKRDVGDTLFAAMTEHTLDHFDAGNALSLGLEVQEIEKDWTWKKNNIHQIIKDESHG
jgi:5-carboxymethyl-2-hydroxymuconate isomerase